MRSFSVAPSSVRNHDDEVRLTFVDGGDDPSANPTGNAFFVIDLATDQKLWQYPNHGASNDRDP